MRPLVADPEADRVFERISGSEEHGPLLRRRMQEQHGDARRDARQGASESRATNPRGSASAGLPSRSSSPRSRVPVSFPET